MSGCQCLLFLGCLHRHTLIYSSSCSEMLAGPHVLEEVCFGLHLEVREDHQDDSGVFQTSGEGLLLL